MKACDYCGKESEDVLVICAGCGADFPASIHQPEPPVIAPQYLPLVPLAPRELKAGLATAFFGVYLGTQLIGGFIAGFIALFSSPFEPAQGVRVHGAILDAIMPWTIIVTMLMSGLAVMIIAMSMQLTLNDTSPTGPAWVRGSWRDIIKALLTGVILAVLWVVLMTSFGHQPQTDDELGPMTRMASTAGFGRVAWLIAALVLAPPVEELLFRGIFYAGYRKSFGAPVATLVTTTIFVLLHYPEFIHQPLAIVALTSMALIALWWRLRSNALGPSIAAHFGYNAVIAATLFLIP
jgi:membrane protease YdiL (CAAX protease family)